jgi:chemotaxis protein CheZ
MRDGTLTARLAQLQARYPAGEAALIGEVALAVLATGRGDLSGPEARLLGEIEDLARSIATAREEIAALRVDDITTSHIPAATDELDAIVAHTAAATDSILEVCETLDALAAELQADPAPRSQAEAASLQGATTRIYEACSFQDITGQRISKVVATLKAIDGKVAGIIATFGGHAATAAPETAEAVPLLNGPQLPAAAMGQNDIDRLLASFD